MLYIKYGVKSEDSEGYIQNNIQIKLFEHPEFCEMFLGLLENKIKRLTDEKEPMIIYTVFYG